jgi:SAM-dependent methyltransferase
VSDSDAVSAGEPNLYSARWFATFLDTLPQERTAKEVAFVMRMLPLPHFRSVLDLACGPGRHAIALARNGYRVTGWDRDPAVISAARFAAAADGIIDARFHARDVRTLSTQDGPFDAIISMWASFGHFDDAANLSLLEQMRAALRPGGRVLLDIYDGAFFRGREGERLHARGGIAVRERLTIERNRLKVELRYGDGEIDRFQWQIFTAAEVKMLALQAGLACILACADFEAGTPPAGESARMQLLLERH